MVTFDDSTISPRSIVEDYREAYRCIHKREPQCRYIGNQWYHVNGETVHRITLVDEIARLRSLAPVSAKPARAERSVIQRLIARLRGL